MYRETDHINPYLSHRYHGTTIQNQASVSVRIKFQGAQNIQQKDTAADCQADQGNITVLNSLQLRNATDDTHVLNNTEFLRFHREDNDKKNPRYIHLRLLLTNDEASAIIGIKTSTLVQLKKKYPIDISVSKHELGCSDRILYCGGPVDKVIKLIEELLNILIKTMTIEMKNKRQPFSFLRSLLPTPKVNEFGDMIDLTEIYSLRFIVNNLKLSAIIGKEGRTIKSLMKTHNVKLIASNQHLPDSDERVLEIQGIPQCISSVIKDIGSIIIGKHLNIEYFGEKHYYPHKAKHIMKFSKNCSSAHYYVDNNSKNPGVINETTRKSIDVSVSSQRKADQVPSEKNTAFDESETSETYQQVVECIILSDDQYIATVVFPERLVGVMMGVKGNRITNLRDLTKTSISLVHLESSKNSLSMAKLIVKSKKKSNVKKATAILMKNLKFELRNSF